MHMIINIFLLATAVSATTFRCKSSLDCGLNGECVGGACECDKGWRGEVCGEMDFLPSSKQQRGLYLDGTSTWGGTPVRDPDGRTFHLFAELMANHCNLSTWVNNSQIVHATAPSPLGPFRVQSVAYQPFRHNVGVARTPNGTWLMFNTGCDVWPDTLDKCTNQSRAPPTAGTRPPMP